MNRNQSNKDAPVITEIGRVPDSTNNFNPDVIARI